MNPRRLLLVLALSPLLVIFLSLFLVSPLTADVRLPGFFGDHMVLQQQKNIKVWGWADANEQVTVQIGHASSTTMAKSDGTWQVELPPRDASRDAVSIVVKGKNTLRINDVLIGEVWLCSGQSNMEWTVASSTNSKQEIAAASYPLIRHLKVAHRPSPVPLDDVSAAWQLCAPNTVGSFTACGYFMARKLQRELGVPIGLINSSWGGTRVEPWTPPVGFEQVDAVHDIYQSVIGRTPGTSEYRQRLSNHIAATEAWLGTAKGQIKTTKTITPSPAFPTELVPFRSHQDPTMLYNGMIHALVGYPIRGAIWYQGESNHTEGMLYFEKKKALIQGWRSLWGQGDFPFYYVQIAPFQYGGEDPTILGEFWEAQAAVETLPNTGMVVINDIATLKDIHPPNKQDVGLRLATLALKHDYGRNDLVASSPTITSVDVLADRLKVHFTNTGGGLKTDDGGSPSHFEVIGQGSGGFKSATAKIDGDAIVLTSDAVSQPVAFRFAWHKLAEPNLIGGTGLPVGAVRGGKVPEFMDQVPNAEDYQLVYELDLNNLSSDVKYDIDNSRKINDFDHVAYLLELESEAHGVQNVFVTVAAFTDDIRKIAVPTAASNATFQQPLKDTRVYSNVPGIETGKVASANIEFWSNNYGTGNSASVAGASGDVYDFGDAPVGDPNGYGSMQIHNTAVGQTLFSINHWSQGATADLGIGNSEGDTRDWTFTGNASSYSKKRLRVYAK